MGDNSHIEWTDATWNPTTGCQRVSPGCDHCYAIRQSIRVAATGNAAYQGVVGYDAAGRVDWTGRVKVLPERLDQPLRWTKPRRIFVNSMSDLFHADVPDEYIAEVFAVMALASQHTFQVLTKRHARMRSLLNNDRFTDPDDGLVAQALPGHSTSPCDSHLFESWPLANVWLGVSVENQRWANIRIPALLETPAAVRFVSGEPLLGPVNLAPYLRDAGTLGICYDIDGCWWHEPGSCEDCRSALDWVIVGGESGPDARPMHPQWARDIRDQCVRAGVPFVFKQWGAWASLKQLPYETSPKTHTRRTDVLGKEVFRVGKKAAGRLLDGRVWDEYPEVARA